MNNKELVAELAKRLEIPKGKAGRMLDIAANTLVSVRSNYAKRTTAY